MKDPQFLLSTRVLAARFKNRLRQHLERKHNELLRKIPAAAWRQRWVVDVQPVGSGQSALKYLAAYVYRTALGRQRILRDQDGKVTFPYRAAEDGRTKLCTVSAHEFLRRFLQHVLPRGFQRVRYFGWLAPAAKRRWQRIQTLLDWQPAQLPPPPPRPPWRCPHCGAPMRLIGPLARAPPRHP